MTLTELSIKRPPLIIVIFTVLAVLGLFSYNQLRYELIPDVTPPYVTVMTIYPGGSPKEVETSVTKVLEDAVSSIDKIKRVFASSSEGVSFIFIEFNMNANADVSLQNVQRKIAEVVNQLPNGAESPILSKFSLTEIPIIRMGVTSEMPSREFYQFMKDKVKPRLTKLEGVGQVNFIGGDEREIKVNLDLDKLYAYNIPVLQVMQIIKSSNFDFPVGKIKDMDGQYIVRISGKFSKLDELKNLIVGKSEQGGNIKLKDIAEVQDGQKETVTYSRLNGLSSLGIMVMKQTDANAVEVSELVRKELNKIETDNVDKNIKFNIAQDISSFTLQAAHAVNEDLLIAIILVAIVMLVFLHSIRNSIIVMIAIPSSLVSTFIAMYAFDFSLNLMTLLALSLVIGILVDDSIVVLENIYRHLEMGKDRKTAALAGRNEIGFSALSITLVDVVVFLPLSLISGLIGNIVRQYAVVVVVSTLLSLFVSFTITPMLASRFTKLEHLNKKSLLGKFSVWFENWFTGITKSYVKILKVSLNNGWKVVALSGLLLIVSIALIPAGFVGTEFMTPPDRGELSVILELPERITLEDNNRLTLQAEKLLSKIPEVNKMFVNVGASSEGFIGQTSNNICEINVSLVPKDQRNKSDIQVSREIKQILSQIPGAKARVSPIGIFGTSDQAPIEIIITGPDIDDLEKAANTVESMVKKIPGTADVRLSTGHGKPETRIDIDREKLASLGLSLDQVAATLRVAFTGDDESKFREANTEYDIRIIADLYDRNKTANLKNMIFTNMQGEKIELQQFANIYQSVGPSHLSRRDRTSSITVFSQAVGRPSGDIGEDIRNGLATAKLPSGVDVSFGGDLEMQEDSFSSLGLALMIGILFVYLIMVALYNSFIYPFIVLFSIPVAIVGALLALALTMKTLNIFSILGIIMLVGLVGKNAILLVDRTNQMREEEGLSVFDALIEAGQTRLRPILMTTAAMVFGMLPIAVSTGASSELKSALATALVGGLTSSLLLTLVLVPVMYVKVENFKNRFISFIKSKKQQEDSEDTDDNNSLHYKSVVKKLGLFIGFMLFVPVVSSSQTRNISLDDAISIALENNRDIKVAYLEKDKNDKRVKEAYGNAFPNIYASGQYIRNLKLPVFYMPTFRIDTLNGGFSAGPPSNPIEIGSKNNFNSSINMEWPLYQGAIYAGIRAAKIVDEISSESIVNQKAQTITDVKKAYYNILIAKEQFNLINQSIKRGEEALKDVRALFNQGMASDLDTLRAYVGVENLRPTLIKAENGISIAESYLINLLGLPASEEISLTDSLSIAGLEVQELEFAGAYEEAASRRPEISLMKLQVKASEEMINYEASGHMPGLAAFGQYKVEYQNDEFEFSRGNWPNSAYVGLNLSIPLFSGFKTQARVQQAKIEKRKLETQLDNLRRLIGTEVRVNLSGIEESRKRIEVQSKTVRSAERSYELTRSRWIKGLSRQTELFDAELALTQAKTNYLQAIYDYLIAEAELEKTLGRTGRM